MWLTEPYIQSLFPCQTKVGVEGRVRVDELQSDSAISDDLLYRDN